MQDLGVEPRSFDPVRVGLLSLDLQYKRKKKKQIQTWVSNPGSSPAHTPASLIKCWIETDPKTLPYACSFPKPKYGVKN